MNTSEWNRAERRVNSRSGLHLKLAVLYPPIEGRPARPMFHGKTEDICMSGLSIVVDYNVFQEGAVTVVLALPPVHAGAPRKVVTATAEMTYAIHSSKLDAFKIGLAFRAFRGEGKALLQAALRRGSDDPTLAGVQDPGAGSEARPPRDSQPFGWW